MNVFIVEDEPIARERLIRLLKEIGNVNIVGAADSKEKALSEMKDKEIDVLFLDIKLPDGTASICRYFKKRYIKNLPIRREEKF